MLVTDRSRVRRSLPVAPQLLSTFVVEFRAGTPPKRRNSGAFRHLEWFCLRVPGSFPLSDSGLFWSLCHRNVCWE